MAARVGASMSAAALQVSARATTLATVIMNRHTICSDTLNILPTPPGGRLKPPFIEVLPLPYQMLSEGSGYSSAAGQSSFELYPGELYPGSTPGWAGRALETDATPARHGLVPCKGTS